MYSFPISTDDILSEFKITEKCLTEESYLVYTKTALIELILEDIYTRVIIKRHTLAIIYNYSEILKNLFEDFTKFKNCYMKVLKKLNISSSLNKRKHEWLCGSIAMQSSEVFGFKVVNPIVHTPQQKAVLRPTGRALEPQKPKGGTAIAEKENNSLLQAKLEDSKETTLAMVSGKSNKYTDEFCFATNNPQQYRIWENYLDEMDENWIINVNSPKLWNTIRPYSFKGLNYNLDIERVKLEIEVKHQAYMSSDDITEDELKKEYYNFCLFTAIVMFADNNYKQESENNYRKLYFEDKNKDRYCLTVKQFLQWMEEFKKQIN